MLKAIIFDFDGIIANTEPTHLEAFKRILNEKGIELTDTDYYEKYLAFDDKRLLRELLKKNCITFTESYVDKLIQKKHNLINELFTTHVELFPGVVEFLNRIRERYILSIASGALKAEIEFILNKFNIADKFNNITSAEDVENCKPDPEVFKKSLATINDNTEDIVHSSECVVIEDSIHGVEAAIAAKMRCIAITNSYCQEYLIKADLVVNGFDEINIEMLEDIFSQN